MEGLTINEAYMRGPKFLEEREPGKAVAGLSSEEVEREVNAYLETIGIDPETFRGEFFEAIIIEVQGLASGGLDAAPAVLMSSFLAGVEYGRANVSR